MFKNLRTMVARWLPEAGLQRDSGFGDTPSCCG